MSLFYFARQPQIRRITADDHAAFKKLAWNPHELIQLRLMTHRELMGLMMFCGIRVFNDTPIMACTDDELRMAYLVWRGSFSQAQRQAMVGTLEKIKRQANKAHEGILWWLQDM